MNLMQSLCEAKRSFMSTWEDGLSPDYRFNFVCWVDEKISQFKRYGKISFGDCENSQYPPWVSQTLYNSVREKFDRLLADTSTRGKQAIKKSLLCLDILNRQMEDDRAPKIRKESRTPRKSCPRKTESTVSESKQKVDDNVCSTASKLSQADSSDEKIAKSKHKSASDLISEEMTLTCSPAKYIKLDDFGTPVSSPLKITKKTPVKNIITALQESMDLTRIEKSGDFESIFGQFVNVTSKISKTPTKTDRNPDKDLEVSEQENIVCHEKQVIKFIDFCGEDCSNGDSNMCVAVVDEDSNMVSDVCLSEMDVEGVTHKPPTESAKITESHDSDFNVSDQQDDTGRSEKQVIEFTDFFNGNCLNEDSNHCPLVADEDFNMVSDDFLSGMDVDRVTQKPPTKSAKITESHDSDKDLEVSERQENVSRHQKQVIEFTDFCAEGCFNEDSNHCPTVADEDSNMVSDDFLSRMDVGKVNLISVKAMDSEKIPEFCMKNTEESPEVTDHEIHNTFDNVDDLVL